MSVESRPVNQSWKWISALLLSGGVALIVLLLLFMVTARSVDPSDLLFFIIYLAAPVLALLAYWRVRQGLITQAAWMGLAVGIISLILSFLTGYFIPIIQPVINLIRFFSAREAILFLTHISFVVLAVAGFWALIAYQIGKRRLLDSGGPTPTAPSQILYDENGNPVTVMYPAQTSVLAVIAFVLVWLVTPVGLILGYVALSEIRQSNGTKTGEALARAAVILGWIFVVLSTIAIALIFANA